MAVKLYAVAPGDESVGIRSAAWTVDDIELDDNEHREAVRESFVAAFESLVGDRVVVTFSDERCEEEPPAHSP